MMKKIKIPKGLSRCPKCGEYKGMVREKDISLPDPKLGYETPNGDGLSRFCCICEGITCHICKKNKAQRRPVSNYFDEKTGEIFHTPGLPGVETVCDECRKKGAEQEQKRSGKVTIIFPYKGRATGEPKK